METDSARNGLYCCPIFLLISMQDRALVLIFREGILNRYARGITSEFLSKAGMGGRRNGKANRHNFSDGEKGVILEDPCNSPCSCSRFPIWRSRRKACICCPNCSGRLGELSWKRNEEWKITFRRREDHFHIPKPPAKRTRTRARICKCQKPQPLIPVWSRMKKGPCDGKEEERKIFKTLFSVFERQEFTNGTTPEYRSQARYKYAVQLTPYRGNSWRFSRRFSRRQKKRRHEKKGIFLSQIIRFHSFVDETLKFCERVSLVERWKVYPYLPTEKSLPWVNVDTLANMKSYQTAQLVFTQGNLRSNISEQMS